MTQSNADNVGRLIRDARIQRGLTQDQLATQLGAEIETIAQIEQGNIDLSITMIDKIADALENRLNRPPLGVTNFRIQGGNQLTGRLEVRSSKNAAVALLCASLLNKGRTTLRGIARIEEVNRLIEVLESIGVDCIWSQDKTNLVIQRPEKLQMDQMNQDAARRTRSVIMFLGPLMHFEQSFMLPYAGGCNLGARTVEPHLQALRHFGLEVIAKEGHYRAENTASDLSAERFITLTERGDTVTENAIMAAALSPGTTVIRNASPNYMVQDLCVFLEAAGVKFEGIGTTTLSITGVEEINQDLEYSISEDPIEAMSLITTAIVTNSNLTITRCPIEFLEIELAVLKEMGQKFEISKEYASFNGFTRLVDLKILASELTAAPDKIHPMPFPGLNIDNLPFFGVIAACAPGETMIHDWVYENRAIHLLELSKLGAQIQLLDPHRIMVKGPTKWHRRDMTCPPALRPAVCLMIAMLAAPGESILRDVYMINRGYEDWPNRLNSIGAQVEVFQG